MTARMSATRMRPSPPARQAAATTAPAGVPVGEDAHRLVGLERGQDERPPESGRELWFPGFVETGDAEHDGVLDGRDLLDAQPDRGFGRRAGRDPVGEIGGRSDRFARDDDQTGIERRVVHDDPLEAVAHVESDALAAIVEGDPAGRMPKLESGPSEDERPMGVVLECILGVDPPADPDIPRPATGREGPGLGHADLRGRGQEAPDAVVRAVRPQDEHARDERGKAGDQGDEG